MEKKKSSLIQWCIRIWQLIAAIGAFGFQIGASPYSKEPPPFETLGLLYYGWVICWLSIVWSVFYITKSIQIKRFLLILFDLVLAALFGVCVCYEISSYTCKPGIHHGWCDFYNTGLFFLMSLFLTYIINTIGDVIV